MTSDPATNRGILGLPTIDPKLQRHSSINSYEILVKQKGSGIPGRFIGNIFRKKSLQKLVQGGHLPVRDGVRLAING